MQRESTSSVPSEAIEDTPRTTIKHSGQAYRSSVVKGAALPNAGGLVGHGAPGWLQGL